MTQEAIQVQVVYSDDHLLQFETSVHFASWAGVERAYIDYGAVTSFAQQLLDVAAGNQTKAALLGTGLELILFEYGAARKLGVEVQITKIFDKGPRGEPRIGALHLTAPTEHGLVPRFAQELARLGERREGTATLTLLPEWPS